MATQRDLLTQLEKAIALMAGKLDEEQPASLTELAAAAAISPFHFHRVYRLLLGETCQQTFSRLRLAKATSALAAQQSVTEAAAQAGFSSSQALAKGELSVNATSLKADPERLSLLCGELQQPRLLTDAPYQVALVSLAPVTVLSITTRGTYPALNDHYGWLFGLLADPAAVQAIVGLAYEDVDGALPTARFDCALLLKSDALVPSVAQGANLASGLAGTAEPVSVEPGSAEPALVGLGSGESVSGDRVAAEPAHWQQLAGQHYLVLRHQGSYQRLGDSIDWLYRYCLSEGAYQPADAPCLHHYLDDPEQTGEDALRTDIYLPVQAMAAGASR